MCSDCRAKRHVRRGPVGCPRVLPLRDRRDREGDRLLFVFLVLCAFLRRGPDVERDWVGRSQADHPGGDREAEHHQLALRDPDAQAVPVVLEAAVH